MIKRFLCLCFILTLALTSQSLALARGQTHVAGQMILCIGQDTIVVLIDEQGNPVEHPHICPDCTSSLIAAVPIYQPQIDPAVWGRGDTVMAPYDLEYNVNTDPAKARAPPFVMFF